MLHNSDATTQWCYTIVMLQHSDATQQWCCNTVTLHNSDAATQWCYNTVMLHNSDVTTQWRYTTVMLQHSDATQQWCYKTVMLQHSDATQHWCYKMVRQVSVLILLYVRLLLVCLTVSIGLYNLHTVHLFVHPTRSFDCLSFIVCLASYSLCFFSNLPLPASP